MSIANLKRSALRLQNLDPSVLITKTLISAAIVLGSCVVGAAPASADPGPASAGPNPFSALSCNCREAAPPDSPAVREEEVHRGIQAGLSASPGASWRRSPAPTTELIVCVRGVCNPKE
jgi:hypothetical protein